MAGRTKQTVQRTSRKNESPLREAKADDGLEARYQELQTLHEISQITLSSPDLKTTLEAILEKTLSVTRLDVGNIRLFEPSGDMLMEAYRGYRDAENVHRHHVRGGSGPDSGVLVPEVIAARKTFVLEDISATEGLRTFKREGVRSAIVVPVATQEEALGVIQVGSRRERKFQPDEIRLLEAVGNQMGMAVQKARLYDETQRNLADLKAANLELERSTREQRVLREFLSNLLLLDLDDLLQRVTKQAAFLFQAEYAWLRLFDEEGRIRTRAVAGEEAVVRVMSRVEEKGKLVGRGKWMLENRQPLAVRDIAQDPLHKSSRGVEAGLHGFLGAPLFSRDKKPLGVLHILTRSPRDFSQHDLDLIEQFTNVTSIALENARLFKEIKKGALELAKVNLEIEKANLHLNRLLKEQHALREILTQINFIDMDELLKKITQHSLNLLKADHVQVRLLEKNGLLRLAAVAGEGAERFRDGLKMGSGRSSWVMENRRPLAVKDIGQDKVFGPGHFLMEIGIKGYLLLPLISRAQRPIGVLGISTLTEREFTQEEIDLAEQFAAGAAIAIENARLYQQSQRQEKIQKLLKELGQDITSLDIDSLLKKVTEKVREFFEVDVSDVRVIEKGFSRLMGVSGVEAERVQVYSKGVGRGRSKWIVENRRPLLIPDITQATEVPGGESISQIGIRGYLAVPLFSRGGEVIGILRALSFQPREFTQEEVDLLQQLANGVAVALEDARLFKETEQRAQETMALHAITEAVTRFLDTEEILKKAVDKVVEVLGVRECILRLREGDELVAKVYWNREGLPLPEEHQRRKLGEGLSGHAAKTGEPLLIDQREKTSAIPTGMRTRESSQILAVVPITVRGEVVGTLGFGATALLPSRALDFLKAVGNQVGIALEHARLFEETRKAYQEMQTLYEVSQSVLGSPDLKAVLEGILDKALTIGPFDLGNIRLFDPNTEVLEPVASQGYRELENIQRHRQLARDPTTGEFTLRGLSTKGAFVEENVPGCNDLRTLRKEGVQSAVLVPVRAGKEVLGMIQLGSRTPRKFKPEQVHLLEAIGNQMGIAVQKARLFEETERRAEEQETLNAIAMAANQSLRLDEILQISLDRALHVTGRERGHIRLKDPVTGELKLGAHRGISEEYVEALLHGRTAGGKSDQVFQSGEPLVINDIEGTILREETRREGSNCIAWIPLKAQGKVVGILNVYTSRPIPFEPQEVKLLQAIGNVIGVALENARLFEETRKAYQEMQTLYEVSQSVLSSPDLKAVLEGILDKAMSIGSFDLGNVRLFDPNAEVIDTVIHRGYRDEENVQRHRQLARDPKTGQFNMKVFSSKGPYVEENIPACDGLRTLKKEGVQSAVLVTVRAGEEILGMLQLGSRTPRKFKPEQIHLLEAIGNQMGIAVQKAELYERTKRAAEIQGFLKELSQDITSLEIDSLTKKLTEKVREVFKADISDVRVMEQGVWRVMGISGIEPHLLSTPKTARGLSSLSMKQRQPLMVPDITKTDLPLGTTLKSLGVHGCLLAPLFSRRGEAIGVLRALTYQPRVFSQEEIDLLQQLANGAAIAIENARLFEETNRLVDRLKMTARQLDAKNKELNTFVYTVSHDLKAPLVSLQGMADLIFQDYGEKLDGEGLHYLERLKVNVQHMERLVLDLLALSRVGREGRHPEEVSLDEVLDVLMAEHSEKIQSRGIRVTRHSLPTLLGIRTQIEQVMANLLSNAIKYLGESPSPLVEIGARDKGEMVECYVKDNGIGIDPAYHEKIFEIFQRLKEIEAEGTGVGLAIAKKIIEGGGGRIWVESTKGQGATFHFTWPKTHPTNKHEEVNP